MGIEDRLRALCRMLRDERACNDYLAALQAAYPEETVEERKWSDGIAQRGRQAWCLLISGDTIHRFVGKSIPGVVAVTGSHYTKEGRWSRTEYRFTLGPGVRMISGYMGWESDTFLEGLAASVKYDRPESWAALARVLGISEPAARKWFDRSPVCAAIGRETADTLDAAERALGALG